MDNKNKIAERLKAPKFDYLNNYQKLYLSWKEKAGLQSESIEKITGRTLDEIKELEEAHINYSTRKTARKKRLIAGEAADVFNFAMTILSLEDVKFDEVPIDGKNRKTFPELQDASAMYREETVKSDIEVLYAEHSLMEIAVKMQSRDEIVELAARLIMRSTAVITKLGFDLFPVVISKLKRNFFKYNPKKLQKLIHELDQSISESERINIAQKQCQKDWKKHKDVWDDLFLLAQIAENGRLDRAIRRLMRGSEEEGAVEELGIFMQQIMDLQ